MDDTIWKDPQKKFKPRNKQAALICIKAKPIFLPPEKEPKPVFVEPLAVKLARENKEREARVAAIRATDAEHARKQKESEAIVRERQRILKVIRTTVSECEQKGIPVPASVELLRKKLANFPKNGKRKNP